jgi:putative peptidoglycan lipid II flippase
MSKLRIASILLIISTLLLKFSSMLRDLVIANYFGSSHEADAYLAAMIIPNTLILFMLTGMKEAFLPSYYKYNALGKGFSHLTNIVKGTFWISLAISIIGMAVSPFITPLVYPKAEAVDVAVWTAVIYFASVFLVGINAVYEGYFDAQKKFSFSTFSQTSVVLATIGGTILFHDRLGIYSAALGYFIGTVISFLIKLIYLKPGKFMDWKQPMDRKEVSAFYLIFLPVGLTIAVGQVNLLINTIFSSRLEEGVVANLNYAFRLVNIPQAIFGVTIATIIFPLLAQAKTSNNMALFKRGIEKGLSFMFLFVAPTVTGMVLLMKEIVQVFYQRGEFDATSTALTSEYAIYYVGSVLFYSIQAVIAKGFYTLEKGHYMLRIGIISIVCNIMFNAILVKTMGATGLALSFSLVGFVYSAITFSTLYKISGGFSLRYVAKEYGKVLVATAVMIAVLLSIKGFMASWNVYVYVAVMMVIGAAVYFITLFLARSQSMRELVNMKQFKRKASEGG